MRFWWDIVTAMRAVPDADFTFGWTTTSAVPSATWRANTRVGPGGHRPAGRGNDVGGDDSYFVNQIAGFVADNDVVEAGLRDHQGQFPSPGYLEATAALIKDF